MKGISVWQPWASLIAVGAKRFETRGWRAPNRQIGQDLAMCSAKTNKGIHLSMTDRRLRGICLERLGSLPLPMGAVVAVVTVMACIRMPPLESEEPGDLERTVGDWSDGRWAWSLGNLRALATPVPVLGSQHLFDLPADVEAQVRSQIGGAP